MIKFFRKIREKFLIENKFNKYLIYAIGEIFLVVIGILIALQINNWNNNRIEHKIETNILSEILVNLEKDIINLNSKITYNNDKTKLNRDVLEHLEQRTPLTDSLKWSYARIIGRGNFEPITVAYENLKSKGIDIIHNDSLRIAISELYDFKYFYLTEDLRSDYEHVKSLHETEAYKNIKTIFRGDLAQRWAEPVNLAEIQNNIYFQEVLKQAIGFYSYMNSTYKRGIKENMAVQEQIKNELKQRKK
ncbi:DUF6090 family protein [Flagellimonas sp. GZD32]|uniref:DUF6090 family protein n=1 Tax=Flagellimonas cixiensis TaxID=3228750 RepID=UPI0035C880A4